MATRRIRYRSSTLSQLARELPQLLDYTGVHEMTGEVDEFGDCRGRCAAAQPVHGERDQSMITARSPNQAVRDFFARFAALRCIWVENG